MELQSLTAHISSKLHTFRVDTEYQYLSYIPTGKLDLLVLALHGYGMNPRTMLDLVVPLFGDSAAFASIQAPNQFYLKQALSASEVGYNWGTRAHGTESIALHHRMVMAVGSDLRKHCGIGKEKTILLGFSQPVGYNYRFSATFPDEVAGVIGICGGVPKDWETGDYGRVSAALLHIAREEDEFFPAATTADYARKLRARATDVEFHQLSGGHRFPSKGRMIVQPWVQRVFGVTAFGGTQP